MSEAAAALAALKNHHVRCLLCRHLFGCRRSDRLLTAYHLATYIRPKAAQ